MAADSNVSSVPNEQLELAKRALRRHLSDVEAIEQKVRSPWIWAYLGPERTGLALDAIDDLRGVLSEIEVMP